ncbi:MAG: glycosyltransferase [Lachnospiraceae bacterium]|nr:glycosyltransferase [Lachnospiraceae bacterium]
MDIKSRIKSVLTEQQNKRYRKLLTERTVTYQEWIEKQEDVTDGGKMSEYVYFLMPGCEPSRNAAAETARYFGKFPEAVFLYGDEDVMEAGRRISPWFKPDWSPHLLDCSFYFGNLFAMRREYWESIAERYPLPEIGISRESPLLRKVGEAEIAEYRILEPESFQRWVRQCVREAGGYEKGSRVVGHIPEILCHAQKEAMLHRYEPRVEVTVSEAERSLSIIIPSKDHPEILRTCLAAIPKAAGDLPYEILIVDNGSREDKKRLTEDLVRETSGQEHPVTYLYRPMEFDFSKMCNLGAQAATGELLLFLNDDVELAQPGSLAKLAELAGQEHTGAVGMKLYYPDSVRIQHAGITNLPMGPVHKLQFLADDVSYYFGANRGLRNVLAVTAACLMVDRAKFFEAGGFSEELKVAFNDVDLCFGLYELGYDNVCRNDCFAYHHESLSRGDDESAEKLARLLAERDTLYERHPKLCGIDPYYGWGLGRDGLDTRIRPAYKTAGNRVQTVAGAPSGIHTEQYRQDACVLLRVEDSRGGQIQGYSVVLGDDNACYEKLLVLEGEDGECLAIRAEGQYRPDLVENMPDQTNVGLCGFWVQFAEESGLSGTYRIGMAVKNRVTGLKLISFSNRTVTILGKC